MKVKNFSTKIIRAIIILNVGLSSTEKNSNDNGGDYEIDSKVSVGGRPSRIINRSKNRIKKDDYYTVEYGGRVYIHKYREGIDVDKVKGHYIDAVYGVPPPSSTTKFNLLVNNYDNKPDDDDNYHLRRQNNKLKKLERRQVIQNSEKVPQAEEDEAGKSEIMAGKSLGTLSNDEYEANDDYGDSYLTNVPTSVTGSSVEQNKNKFQYISQVTFVVDSETTPLPGHVLVDSAGSRIRARPLFTTVRSGTNLISVVHRGEESAALCFGNIVLDERECRPPSLEEKQLEEDDEPTNVRIFLRNALDRKCVGVVTCVPQRYKMDIDCYRECLGIHFPHPHENEGGTNGSGLWDQFLPSPRDPETAKNQSPFKRGHVAILITFLCVILFLPILYLALFVVVVSRMEEQPIHNM